MRALARGEGPMPARSWLGSAAMSRSPTCSNRRPSLRRWRGIDVAYYLVHSMGRGSDGDFAQRDHAGAENFAAAAAAAGVRRIVYLGGLGEGSVHLDSRHATAQTLRAGSVPVAYFRAAAVIGAGSESFRTVFYLVRRLPLMVTPRWVTTRTQPIAIDDAVALPRRRRRPRSPARPRDPDRRPRRHHLRRDDRRTGSGARPPAAAAPHRSRSRPGLSSLWIGLVTPVDAGVARPLIEGLATETVVSDPSGMELFPTVNRTPLSRALQEAVRNATVRQ